MSRNELPYFPFYAKDFSADGKVEAMSTSEVGAYILLLCKAWHEEPPATIPSDDRVLARWTRLSMAEWEACKQAVLSCWRACADGRLIQPRLRKEYDKLQIRRSACVEAGKASAAQRSFNERSTSVEPHAYESESGSSPQIDSSPMADFASFWRLYPLRKGKGQAERAWERAARTTAPTLILEAAREYAASPDGQGQFCPHAATWLNGKKWADDRWTWWGKEPIAAQKERAAWIEKDKAISWWATLTPEEQKQTTDSIMEIVRMRAEYDPIRQAWERDYATGKAERFAVEGLKRKGK